MKMRPDVWTLFFLCASANVFAKPKLDDENIYSIEILRNYTTTVYHEKCLEIYYDARETIDVTFIQSGVGEELPFMQLYWSQGNERHKIGEKINDFWAQKTLTLYSEENDGRLQCEISFLDQKPQTLEVHFLKNLSPSASQNTVNLFKIILIALGTFIVVSILIMVLIAIYKYLKNKSSSGNNTSMYPEYYEIVPVNKINDIPKN